MVATKEWDNSYTEKLIEMSKAGKHKEELAEELDISYKTFCKWRQRYQEFNELIELCENYSKCWWVRRGRAGLVDPHFNNTLWNIVMKNAHGYGEKPSERYFLPYEWKGDFADKISIINEMIGDGTIQTEQVEHLFKALNLHAKLHEVLYITPAIARLELNRKKDSGELSIDEYNKEIKILDQSELMRKIVAENITREAQSFNQKNKSNIKPNIKPKVGKFISDADIMDNSTETKLKPQPIIEQFKKAAKGVTFKDAVDSIDVDKIFIDE